MTFLKRKVIFVFWIFTILLIVLIVPVRAQQAGLINITNTGFSGSCGADGQGYILCTPIPGFPNRIDSLGDYFRQIYRYLIALTGMVATISFVYAGALYVLSPANPGYKNDAKTRIKNTVIGVVMVLLTATILYLINPRLLQISDRLELNGPAIQTSPNNSQDYNPAPPGTVPDGSGGFKTMPGNPNPNF